MTRNFGLVDQRLESVRMWRARVPPYQAEVGPFTDLTQRSSPWGTTQIVLGLPSVSSRRSVVILRSSVVHAVRGPDEGNPRGLAGTGQLHVDCMKGAPEAVGRWTRFGCVATLFAVERVTGIEPALSAWELSELMADQVVVRNVNRPVVRVPGWSPCVGVLLGHPSSSLMTPRLTRPGVAAAAIELADADGLAAVTMRSVASVLGAAPASLYRVIESRDELLELMTDTIIGEFTYSRKLIGSGPEGLLSLARQARSLYRRHPWMLNVPAPGPVLGHNALEYLEHALSALRDLPISSQQKLEAIGILSGLVKLLATNESEHQQAGRLPAAWQAATAMRLAEQATDGQHPNLANVLARTPSRSASTQDTKFDRVVLRVLGGLLGPSTD
jgi:AcrR family transcriptional regulator